VGLDGGDGLGEDAEDEGTESLEVDHVQEVGEEFLDEGEEFQVVAEQQLVNEGVIGLRGEERTSAAVLLRGRSATVSAFMSESTLFRKLPSPTDT
jgi:hypothetical protein